MSQTAAQTLSAWEFMYGEEYGRSIAMMINLLRLVPISVFENARDKFDRAETLGPILDPTGYREMASEIHNNLQLAVLLLEFRRKLEGQITVSQEGGQ